jgi:hypothetical protein
MKTLGLAAAAALCVMLAANPGRAQEDAPKASSDRGASRASGVDSGDSGEAIGAISKHNDSGGGRGGSQSRPAESDAARAGSSVRAGPGTDASRKGAAAPPGALGTPSADSGAALSRDVDPIRLDGGFAGLQRRANRKSLIANAPKMPAAQSANSGAALPVKRAGADGGAVRNAVGIVVPGGQDHAVLGSMGSAGAGVRGSGSGIVSVGTAIGNIDGANAHRPAVPANAITSPAGHTSGINGTTMGHIASGPSYIGGPTRDRSGINGTAVRPRY